MCTHKNIHYQDYKGYDRPIKVCGIPFKFVFMMSTGKEYVVHVLRDTACALVTLTYKVGKFHAPIISPALLLFQNQNAVTLTLHSKYVLPWINSLTRSSNTSLCGAICRYIVNKIPERFKHLPLVSFKITCANGCKNIYSTWLTIF